MKAMILAAGFGTRLGELTKNTPKCLVDINGKPIIRLVSENLKKAGVNKVIINLHYLPEMVEEYCSNSLRDLFDVIEFSREPEILGTGGGLKAAQAFFKHEDFFYLVNADIYSDFDLKLMQDKASGSTLGVLAVMDRQDSSYLCFDQNQVFKGWIKSGDKTESGIRAFCGMQLLSPRIFKYLNDNQDKSFSIINTYCSAKEQGEKLLAYDIGKSSWFDMGTAAQLEALRKYLTA